MEVEAGVGVAGAKLGSWRKMERNYPRLLSRTVVEIWRDVPEPGACMGLGVKRSPRSLALILTYCLVASAEVKAAGRYCYQPA